MKNFHTENYYELLEVHPKATPDQIQRAYEHAKRTFSEDSLAVYSLFGPEERRQLIERIEHAYRVLMNEAARRRYNQEIGLSKNSDGVGPAPQAPPHPRMDQALPEPVTGQALKNLRERLGISLQEISQRTRIHLPYLEYIEADRYDKLPPEVYLRGYLGQYASTMGLDASRVVQGYLKNFPKRHDRG